MVIALPRSGTTWAANWLTTDETVCFHDPLWTTHFQDFDRLLPARGMMRTTGISCTGLWRWVDWVNAHPARKLILHRDLSEVCESLVRCGVPEAIPTSDAPGLLGSIDGWHTDWKSMFNPDIAEQIWEHFFGGLPFDEERHAELTQMTIQPRFDTIRKCEMVQRRLLRDLARNR